MPKSVCVLLRLGLISAAGLGAGCHPNVSGELAAEKTGTLLDPPAPRESAWARYGGLCGTPDATLVPRSGIITRPIHLQQVTARSAAVVWTAPWTDVASVDVTTLEGDQVGTFESHIDATEHLSFDTQHIVELFGLEPSTAYCYAARLGNEVFERGGLRTAPLPRSGQTVSFVAFGDTGTGSEDQRTLRDQLETVPLDFAVLAGDIAYGTGKPEQLDMFYFDVYDDLLRYFPVYPVTGNHDYGTADAAPFREAFVLPDNGGPFGVERWYSFDYGDVHVVALDTEKFGQEQADWFDADLTHNELPWVIVFAHKPPFSSGTHGSNSKFRRWFVPIIEEHRVQLVIGGHDHHYERTVPINGVTYIVTGGGGKGVRSVGRSDFTAHAQAVIHFVYVTVAGDVMRLHAIDGSGREFDGIELLR